MPVCAPDSSARSLTGALRFRAAADAAGITRVFNAHRSAPLQLQRPLYLDPRCAGLATVHVINATAGVFEGDALTVGVDVMQGASLELRTPTMTRVYSMAVAGEATSVLELDVGPAGYVESLPAPVILCAGAALRQETRASLAVGAHAAIGDVWAFGRVAHGELHGYRELDARTEVSRNGSLILAERCWLRPADGLAEIATGGYAAYGSLTLVGPLADGAFLRRTRELLGAYRGPLSGASLLAEDAGVAVRILGSSAHGVQTALNVVVREFRNRAAPPARGESIRGGGR